MKTIKVVAAVIKKGNLLFATERGYGEFIHKWEFPGGKVEPGEKDEEALKREIKEELAASIEVDQYVGKIEWDYPTFHLDMNVYLCHLLNPHLELLEAENAKWLDKENLDNEDWLPADRTILKKLKSLLEDPFA